MAVFVYLGMVLFHIITATIICKVLNIELPTGTRNVFCLKTIREKRNLEKNVFLLKYQ